MALHDNFDTTDGDRPCNRCCGCKRICKAEGIGGEPCLVPPNLIIKIFKGASREIARNSTPITQMRVKNISGGLWKGTKCIYKYPDGASYSNPYHEYRQKCAESDVTTFFGEETTTLPGITDNPGPDKDLPRYPNFSLSGRKGKFRDTQRESGRVWENEESDSSKSDIIGNRHLPNYLQRSPDDGISSLASYGRCVEDGIEPEKNFYDISDIYHKQLPAPHAGIGVSLYVETVSPHYLLSYQEIEISGVEGSCDLPSIANGMHVVIVEDDKSFWIVDYASQDHSIDTPPSSLSNKLSPHPYRKINLSPIVSDFHPNSCNGCINHSNYPSATHCPHFEKGVYKALHHKGNQDNCCSQRNLDGTHAFEDRVNGTPFGTYDCFTPFEEVVFGGTDVLGGTTALECNGDPETFHGALVVKYRSPEFYERCPIGDLNYDIIERPDPVIPDKVDNPSGLGPGQELVLFIDMGQITRCSYFNVDLPGHLKGPSIRAKESEYNGWGNGGRQAQPYKATGYGEFVEEKESSFYRTTGATPFNLNTALPSYVRNHCKGMYRQGNIKHASNHSPIVITTRERHLLKSGDKIKIDGVKGNVAANTYEGGEGCLNPLGCNDACWWTVGEVIDQEKFEILDCVNTSDGSVGKGVDTIDADGRIVSVTNELCRSNTGTWFIYEDLDELRDGWHFTEGVLMEGRDDYDLAEGYYVEIIQEEVCPVCCDMYMENTVVVSMSDCGSATNRLQCSTDCSGKPMEVKRTGRWEDCDDNMPPNCEEKVIEYTQPAGHCCSCEAHPKAVDDLTNGTFYYNCSDCGKVTNFDSVFMDLDPGDVGVDPVCCECKCQDERDKDKYPDMLYLRGRSYACADYGEAPIPVWPGAKMTCVKERYNPVPGGAGPDMPGGGGGGSYYEEYEKFDPCTGFPSNRPLECEGDKILWTPFMHTTCITNNHNGEPIIDNPGGKNCPDSVQDICEGDAFPKEGVSCPGLDPTDFTLEFNGRVYESGWQHFGKVGASQCKEINGNLFGRCDISQFSGSWNGAGIPIYDVPGQGGRPLVTQAQTGFFAKLTLECGATQATHPKAGTNGPGFNRLSLSLDITRCGYPTATLSSPPMDCGGNFFPNNQGPVHVVGPTVRPFCGERPPPNGDGTFCYNPDRLCEPESPCTQSVSYLAGYTPIGFPPYRGTPYHSWGQQMPDAEGAMNSCGRQTTYSCTNQSQGSRMMVIGISMDQEREENGDAKNGDRLFVQPYRGCIQGRDHNGVLYGKEAPVNKGYHRQLESEAVHRTDHRPLDGIVPGKDMLRADPCYPDTVLMAPINAFEEEEIVLDNFVPGEGIPPGTSTAGVKWIKPFWIKVKNAANLRSRGTLESLHLRRDLDQTLGNYTGSDNYKEPWPYGIVPYPQGVTIDPLDSRSEADNTDAGRVLSAKGFRYYHDDEKFRRRVADLLTMDPDGPYEKVGRRALSGDSWITVITEGDHEYSDGEKIRFIDAPSSVGVDQLTGDDPSISAERVVRGESHYGKITSFIVNKNGTITVISPFHGLDIGKLFPPYGNVTITGAPSGRCEDSEVNNCEPTIPTRDRCESEGGFPPGSARWLNLDANGTRRILEILSCNAFVIPAEGSTIPGENDVSINFEMPMYNFDLCEGVDPTWQLASSVPVNEKGKISTEGEVDGGTWSFEFDKCGSDCYGETDSISKLEHNISIEDLQEKIATLCTVDRPRVYYEYGRRKTRNVEGNIIDVTDWDTDDDDEPNDEDLVITTQEDHNLQTGMIVEIKDIIGFDIIRDEHKHFDDSSCHQVDDPDSATFSPSKYTRSKCEAAGGFWFNPDSDLRDPIGSNNANGVFEVKVVNNRKFKLKDRETGNIVKPNDNYNGSDQNAPHYKTGSWHAWNILVTGGPLPSKKVILEFVNDLGQRDCFNRNFGVTEYRATGGGICIKDPSTGIETSDYGNGTYMAVLLSETEVSELKHGAQNHGYSGPDITDKNSFFLFHELTIGQNDPRGTGERDTGSPRFNDYSDVGQTYPTQSSGGISRERLRDTPVLINRGHIEGIGQAYQAKDNYSPKCRSAGVVGIHRRGFDITVGEDCCSSSFCHDANDQRKPLAVGFEMISIPSQCCDRRNPVANQGCGGGIGLGPIGGELDSRTPDQNGGSSLCFNLTDMQSGVSNSNVSPVGEGPNVGQGRIHNRTGNTDGNLRHPEMKFYMSNHSFVPRYFRRKNGDREGAGMFAEDVLMMVFIDESLDGDDGYWRTIPSDPSDLDLARRQLADDNFDQDLAAWNALIEKYGEDNDGIKPDVGIMLMNQIGVNYDVDECSEYSPWHILSVRMWNNLENRRGHRGSVKGFVPPRMHHNACWGFDGSGPGGVDASAKFTEAMCSLMGSRINNADDPRNGKLLMEGKLSYFTAGRNDGLGFPDWRIDKTTLKDFYYLAQGLSSEQIAHGLPPTIPTHFAMYTSDDETMTSPGQQPAVSDFEELFKSGEALLRDKRSLTDSTDKDGRFEGKSPVIQPMIVSKRWIREITRRLEILLKEGY